MRAYWAILSARFRMLLQYRAAALAGLGTQLFWGLIRIMIFGAFYESSTRGGTVPMSWPEVLSYIWLGQAMLMLLPMWADGDVRDMVRNGTVAYELVKPLDLYTLWFSRSIANRAAPTLLRAIPMMAIAGLFLGLQRPATPLAGAACMASTLSALLLSCAISTFVQITTLWTVSGRGITDLIGPCIWIFSGIMLPLPLFPNWMQTLIGLLPFRGLMDIPFRIYTGHIPVTDCAGAIGTQLVWTAILIFAGRLLLSAGTRKLVIQGG
jgi:ABC-2 type transport system permease protein